MFSPPDLPTSLSSADFDSRAWVLINGGDVGLTDLSNSVVRTQAYFNLTSLTPDQLPPPQPNVVPVPASVVFLLSALGIGGVVARRKAPASA